VSAFTYDVECVDLTPAECVAFSQLVTGTCRREVQRSLSAILASVTRPYPETTIDAVQGQARWMWKTAIRM
jgi:hypothetical protein